jgi:hypothetical protein
METLIKYPGYQGNIKKAFGKIKIIYRQARIVLLNQKNKIMEKNSSQLFNATHIPVEPYVLELISKGFCDEKLKECMLLAVNRYNKKCQEAYKQLIIDLKECLEQKSS